MTTKKCRAIVGYDFTLKCETENQTELSDLKACLRANCKRYVFQKEKSETGYIHYQGRLRLIKKALIPKTRELFMLFPKIHFSPTCNTTFAQESFSYVLKDDTRVAGPWSDADREELEIPIQYRISDWLPWQKQIIDELNDDYINKRFRRIYCIVDIKGKGGKTTFGISLTMKGLAEYIPPVNDTKDMMRMCFDLPKTNNYIIDMTRAMSKDKLFGMFSAVEQIKNGYLWDDRYSFKRRFIDAPGIVILTNQYPEQEMLSVDRWTIYTLDDGHLTLYDPSIDGLEFVDE